MVQAWRSTAFYAVTLMTATVTGPVPGASTSTLSSWTWTLQPTEAPPADTPEVDAADGATTPAPAEDFHLLLVVEGVMTDDSGGSRMFTPDSLTWRDPPLPLMAIDRTTYEHDDAKLVGNITRIERRGAEIHGWGPFLSEPDPVAANLIGLIRNGELTGVSVDASASEFEVEIHPDQVSEGDEGVVTIDVGPMVQRVTEGIVLGATAVPFPALGEPMIEIITAASVETAPLLSLGVHFGAVGVHHTGTSDAAWDGAAQEAKLESPMPVDRARAMYAWIDDSTVENDEVAKANCKLPHHEVSDNGTPGVANMKGVAAAMAAINGARGSGPGVDIGIPADDLQGVYNHLAAHYSDADMEPPEAAFSLVASARKKLGPPVSPPREWFDNPRFATPAPLTFTDDGRVLGHVAVWGTCHIGMDGQCLMPPHSPSNYARYRTGEVRTEDGSRVATGRITVGGLHADRSLRAAEAIAHYEDCALAVADVVAGEDEHGIWVAGALRPGVSPEQLRVAMATPPSIDCRGFGSDLDMVNVHLVNVPGFPTPRYAFRMDGALVASAIITTPIEPPVLVATSVLDSLRDRLAASLGRSVADRRAALAARVHPVAV